MAKLTGDVAVTLRYTIRGLEVESEDEDDAAMKLVGLEETHDSDEIVNCGDWDYDAEEISESEEQE